MKCQRTCGHSAKYLYGCFWFWSITRSTCGVFQCQSMPIVHLKLPQTSIRKDPLKVVGTRYESEKMCRDYVKNDQQTWLRWEQMQKPPLIRTLTLPIGLTNYFFSFELQTVSYRTGYSLGSWNFCINPPPLKRGKKGLVTPRW